MWVATGETPTVYRYIDWLLTVPLQMIEFYLILAAIGLASAGMFWDIDRHNDHVGCGFHGRAGYIDATVGFVIGVTGMVYILYEILLAMQETGRTSLSCNPVHLEICA